MNLTPRRLIFLALLMFPLAAFAEDPASLPPVQAPADGAPMVIAPVSPADSAPAQPAPPAPTAEPAPAAAPANPAVPKLSAQAVNDAQYAGGPLPEGLSPLTLKLQILLDEVGMSPGVIDGTNGKNVAKAIAAVEVLAGLPVDGLLDEEVWKRLPHGAPILVDYVITPEDVAGPFLTDGVPTDYAEMAKLRSLAYTGPLEMFGERFHMDVDLLKTLNPAADFNQPGTHIIVAGANQYSVQTPVAALVADKVNAQLRGYDAAGKLVVAYPATIGSTEMPSPSGTHAVNAIARHAAYFYSPKVNFQQGNNKDKLTLPPGPNNPIGTTWIDLTEPTFGIHGTPEPARIDKTNSHGCVRLTNWDVEELATLVKKGVPVEFR